MLNKQYITPEFCRLYHSVTKDQKKAMIRAILDEWDAEYTALAKAGLIDDSIFDTKGK